MNKTTITLRWQDKNVVNLAHKVYRSEKEITFDNLPPHVAYVERDKTEYLDVVDAGKSYYYCVSAVGKNAEKFSDVVRIMARENITPFILTDTSVVRANSDNSYINVISELPHEYSSINLSNNKFFLKRDNHLDIYLFNGDYLGNMEIPEETNRLMFSWNDKVILSDENSVSIMDLEGNVLSKRIFDFKIDDLAINPSGFVIGVICDSVFSIMDQELSDIATYFVGNKSKAVVADGYYGVYNVGENSSTVYKGISSNTLLGKDLLRVNIDEKLRCNLIGNRDIIRYDSDFSFLYKGEIENNLTNVKVDNQGNTFSYDNVNNSICKYGGNGHILKMNEWKLNGIVDYDVPLDPTIVSPVMSDCNFVPLMTPTVNDGISLEDMLRDLSTMDVMIDYNTLEPSEVSYLSNNELGLVKHDINVSGDFNSKYHDLESPVITNQSLEEVDIGFNALESVDIEGDIL